MPAASPLCPRCQRNTATPFGGTSVCLHCAGLRALALDLDENADSLESAVTAPSLKSGERSGLPERIGPYEIVDELGRGGMARVFAARQPRLDRLVALKVLGTGPTNESLEQRFLREIQTVARLRHPHIVAIHDSGRADGYVYFAMDYIEGGDFAQRLRARPLPARTIAVLLEKIAAALAYAHGEGVIHRDLKPSNILLDGDEPRLADFGLAAQLESGGDLTVASAVLGTPHYLAPEAVKSGSAALSAASDLYALGVILYEALAGRTPFAGASSAELPGLLQNSEPPPLRLLAPGTPRDLETICLKCLERDPARRYPSTAVFAADLRHFLAGEPIVARPPGKRERFGRFARKHRTLIAVAGGTGAALAAGIAVSTALAIRATRAERRASQQAAAATAIVNFLKDDLLGKAMSENRPDPTLKVRTVLERASAGVGARFVAQPEIESAIREVLGVTYGGVGDYVRMHHHLERALELSRRERGPDDLHTLEIENSYASALSNIGRDAEAEPIKTRILADFQKRLGEDAPLTLRTADDLGSLLFNQGKFALAEPLLRRTVELLGRASPPNPFATASAVNNLALVLDRLGRAREARELAAKGIEELRRTSGAESESAVILAVTLAGLDGRAGHLDQAVSRLEETQTLATRILGADHPTTLGAMNSLAVAYLSLNRVRDAEPLLVRTIDARRRVLGTDHPLTYSTETSLAAAYRASGRLAEAIELSRVILEKRTRQIGPKHPSTLRSMDLLGAMYTENHQPEAAVPLLRETLELRQQVLGVDHPDTLATMRSLGRAIDQQGPLEPTENFLRGSLLLHEKKMPKDWKTAGVRSQLGSVLARRGRFAEAETLLLGAHEQLREPLTGAPAARAQQAGETAAELAKLYSAWGKPDAAHEWEKKSGR